jgi:hypothetical protein
MMGIISSLPINLLNWFTLLIFNNLYFLIYHEDHEGHEEWHLMNYLIVPFVIFVVKKCAP